MNVIRWGLHMRTIRVHYKAGHKGSYFFPHSLEWFSGPFWNEKFSLNKKSPSFQIPADLVIASLTTVTYEHFTGNLEVFWVCIFFPLRQLRVLKELLMKYWTSVVNIYFQQYNSSALSFSQNKILIWNTFPLEHVPMNLFETVLRIPKFVKVFHLKVSFPFAVGLYFLFDWPGTLCYKTFTIFLSSQNFFSQHNIGYFSSFAFLSQNILKHLTSSLQIRTK